jgi:molybdenum ABC transporter molybdate-binding protein
VFRTASPTPLAVGSLAVLAGLVLALWWREARDRPLVVYAAPTVRLPLEAVAADYERDTGVRVELRYGASEDLLTKVRFPSPVEPADLFAPADDSYVRQARDLGLVGESFPVARVRAVLLLAPGNPAGVNRWPDLLRPGVRVAVPNPAAAVGKLARDHLAATGNWSALRPRVVDVGTVTEAANAAKAGAADAAVVWDAVAAAPAYRGQAVLSVPELAGVEGRIEVAVLAQSRDPDAAARFARYATAGPGLARFRDGGFRVGDRP